MMTTILFISALVCTFIPIRLEYHDRSPFILLWLLNILFIYFPILVNYYQGYNPTVINYSLIFYIICNVTYCLTVYVIQGLSGKRADYRIRDFPVGGYRHTDLLLYGSIIILFLLFISNGLNLTKILSSTLEDKRELGGAQLWMVFLIALLGPFIIYTYKNKKKTLFWLIFASFLIVILYFRSRSILAFMFLPIAYYVLFWVRRGRWYLVIFGGIAYICSQLIKAIRYQGALKEGLDFEVFTTVLPQVIANSFSKGRGDFSIGTYYLDIVKDGEGAGWYGGFTILQKLLSKVIPILDAPTTIEYKLWNYYYGFGQNGSLHPTAYGVAYADGGGFYGIFYFFLLGLIRMGFHKTYIKTYDVRLLGFVMYFILFFSRGSVYNGLMLFLVPYLLWVVLDKTFKFR